MSLIRAVTRTCKKASKVINGKKISLIDTPGLFDTEMSKDVIEKEIKQCVSYSAPGPHAFLVVIKLERITEENVKTIKYIEEIFGRGALNYTIAVFTHGDQLDEQDIDTFVQSSIAIVDTRLKSNEVRRVLKSVAWSFSRWMFKSPSSTRGVPSSGKFDSNTSNSSKKLPS